MNTKAIFSSALLLTALAACTGPGHPDKKEEASLTPADSVARAEKPVQELPVTDSASGKTPAGPVWLRFHLRKGKTYDYVIRYVVTQNGGGQARSTTMNWAYLLNVAEESDSLQKIKATYKRIDMTVDMGNQQKMEFSSEKNVEAADFMQLPSRMFHIMKGKSFTMEVSSRGEVKSVEGFDSITSAVLREMDLPAEMKTGMEKNFNRQFNAEAVKQMFEQSFDLFPGKKVSVGDSWKKHTKVSALGQEITTVYTMKNSQGDRVQLTGTSTLKSAEGTPTGSQTSSLLVDALSGLVIDGVFDQKSPQNQIVSHIRVTGNQR